MIWESNRLLIAAAATLLCATSASAQENQGTPEQRAACTSDAFRTLRQLHSRRHQGRNLLEAEQIGSQRCVSVRLRSGTGPIASRR